MNLRLPNDGHVAAVAAGCRSELRLTGRVSKLVGLLIESIGPAVSVGDLVVVHDKAGQPRLRAEVVGFRDERNLLLPLESTIGIESGQEVHRVADSLTVPVGVELLGRVVDGLGAPIDGHGPIGAQTYIPVRRPAPSAMRRQPVRDFFHTGIRSIDSTVSCGCGQRLGIFAGSGVGKSTLLGMIARNSSADVNVIALVGERGKEVPDFVETVLGPAGLARSVLVVATSDKPPLFRQRAAETALAIAEFFRDQGQNVMFIMDSLTRYAMAQREVGLAVGETPATKGYPSSVFSGMPLLLERLGNNEVGSITSFLTVLVEGDEMDDPIADTARGLLDGHLILDRQLAASGRYPPVDVMHSVSRSMNDVCTPEHIRLARELRELISTYTQAEDMINLGLYKSGTTARIDRAIDIQPAIVDFFNQGIAESAEWAETWERLLALVQS